MVRPERRTAGDLRAAAAIAAIIVAVIALIWWKSTARTTISRPAQSTAPTPVAAKEVPDVLRQRWTAQSSRTLAPVVVGGTVVSGDGHTMTGLEPETGGQRWTYARNEDLCAVSYVYDLALAVYPDSRGCGQVSGVTAATGRRGPTRTSYSDKQVVVTSDGSAALSYGPTRLELWRSDLVRLLSYGEIDARVKPVNTGIGTGCTLMSAAGTDGRAAVLEACKGENDLRLTLIKAAKEEDEPDTKRVPLPGVAADSDARVLAVTNTTTAVYLPTPRPEVVVYDDTGNTLSTNELPTSATVAGAAPAVTRAGDYITWWTGTAVMVFDSKLGYLYTIDDGATLGPATMMAGRLLVPVDTGIAVVDPANGTRERVIAMPHPPGSGPVLPAVVGSMVIEQRGTVLTGYGN